MNVATDGRNPSLRQYVLRGLIFVVVLAIMFVVLFMRYQGAFDSVVPVRAQMEDIGDGLVDSADVRYNGLIVGEVKTMQLSTETGAGGKQIKVVDIDLDPGQAEGIPANVTARTVPSNLFGVNSVEFVAREVLPGLQVHERLGSMALHPTCSSTQLGLNESLRKIAEAMAEAADERDDIVGITGAMTIPACTQRQRDLVRFYFKNRGLPTVYLTEEHQGLFNRAGIAWRYGALLDKTLRAVSQAAAQRLINVVKESV